MFPGGETERSIFQSLERRNPDDVLGKEDDRGSIGFGGNISGTLMPRSEKRQSYFDAWDKKQEQDREEQKPSVHEVPRRIVTLNVQAILDQMKQLRLQNDPAQNKNGENTEASGTFLPSRGLNINKDVILERLCQYRKSEKEPKQKPLEKIQEILPPPTMKPVDLKELQKILDYDPNKGGGDLHSFWDHGFEPDEIARKAEIEARKVFPKQKGFEDDSDAFRHALGSYLMTKRYGPIAAKQILDRHERAPGGNLSPRDTEMGMLQDIYNNRIGRDAALDPKNKDRDPIEVIRELYDGGKLQTHPFYLKRKKRK